ncbi:MAG: hypothetical protein QOD75_1910 [Blastocatellia bacterium]|jgi:hypothetical protein|nr:hypothetical protein [Blastocatellia bacterium]
MAALAANAMCGNASHQHGVSQLSAPQPKLSPQREQLFSLTDCIRFVRRKAANLNSET